jgi:predicted SAM-dependent methyltransferase
MAEKMIGLNVGSGQRPFTTVPGEIEWVNVDKIDRRPQYPIDLLSDGAHIEAALNDSIDYYVLHHCLEHETLGGGDGLIKEAYRVLRPGGSLLIFIPDIRALAIRWLEGGISDYIYVVNLMGAYMGDVADLHKWHYTRDSLRAQITSCNRSFKVKDFDWRTIPGADIARDWWILGMEAIK